MTNNYSNSYMGFVKTNIWTFIFLLLTVVAIIGWIIGWPVCPYLASVLPIIASIISVVKSYNDYNKLKREIDENAFSTMDALEQMEPRKVYDEPDNDW